MKLEAFHSFILPEVLGCPEPLVNSRLVAAAAEFCRETLSWSDIQGPIQLVDQIADYDVDADANSYVITVSGVWVGGRKLEPLAIDIPSTVSFAQEPAAYNMLNDYSVLRVYPTPSAPTATFTMKVCYVPMPTATSLPDYMIRFTDVIAAGAKAELMIMPGMTWSNPKLSEYYRQKFVEGIGNTRSADFHGRVVGPLRVKPRLFGRT